MWIYNLRIAAILMVVMGHAVIYDFESAPPGSASWWTYAVVLVARRWSVPVFLMVSGSLLLGKEEPLGTFYRKRATKVLIPMLFWSVFYTGWTALRWVARPEGDPWILLRGNLLGGVPYYHLWYLSMLLFLYLFIPYYRMIVARSTRRQLKFLVGAGFSMLFVSGIHGVLVPSTPGLWIFGFLSFTPFLFLGHLLATTVRRPPLSALAAFASAAVVAGVLGYAITYLHRGPAQAGYFMGFLSIPTVALSAAVFLLARRWSYPWLGKATAVVGTSTFGIYLSHAAVLDVIQYVGKRIGLSNPVLVILVYTSLTFAGSLGVVLLAKRLPFLRRVV